MHYVIYPDTLFIENFICNLLFLAFMKSLFFPSAKGRRILITAAVTALCNTCISMAFFRCAPILQLGVLFPAAGLMVCGCMELKDGRRMLYLLYEMTLWTLVLGGALQALGQWGNKGTDRMMLSFLVLIIIFWLAEKIFKIYKQKQECMRTVILYWKKRSFHLKGFADTGNHLVDPISQKPVSIITSEAWQHILNGEEEPNYRLIPYQSIGEEHGLIRGIQIDYMAIGEGEYTQIIEKPMIAVTEQSFKGIFHYSILLHSDFC